MEKDMINGIALVKASEYRYKVLKSIGKGMKTPSEIAKEIRIRLNHVSMCLRKLKENKLVECLNEETRKGKLYRLTNLGKNVVNSIKE